VRYQIEITRAAERDGVKKLAGADSLYRVRVGDYRIIYEIQDRAILIIIVRMRHRGEAYR
jgi:mRNA interferase RelE/StbE